MDGVDVLIAEGLRLNALNQFLINEQHELVTPKWDYNFLVHQASSDGLGVTYGVDTEPDIDENTQHEPNAKKRNDQWKKQQGRRNRTNAPDTPLDAGDIIYVAAMTPISLARMEALLLTLAAEREREEARAREAERNSSYAAAGIGRPFRPN